MKTNSLYLASTPRHLYQALALAFDKKETQSPYLIVTSIKMDSPLMKIVNDGESSPFKRVIFLDQGKPASFARFNDFSRIKNLVTEFVGEIQPESVYVGNDKKPLSQWILFQSKSFKSNCVAWYVDEGIASYFYGFSNARKVGEWLEARLKRAIYGRWYTMPKALGASKYIDRAVFSFLEHRQTHYDKINCSSLEPELFQQPEVLMMTNQILATSGMDSELINSLDAVFLMPSLNLVNDIYGSLAKLHQLILSISNKKSSIGIKYHPKDREGSAELEKGIPNLVRIPEYLPIEMLYPILNKNTLVIGDVSSALFTAKWLLPDNELYSVTDGESVSTDSRKPLFDAVDVPILTIDQLLLKLDN